MNINITKESFDLYLKELSYKFRVFAPILKKGQGKFAETDVIGYGQVSSLSEIELEGKPYFSPKEILYPIRETLFYFENVEARVPDIEEKPIVILLRPCDLNGIRKLDTIFLKNGKEIDFYYKRRRDLVKFLMIECTEGYENCFCVSMNSNIAKDYDGALRFDKESVKMKILDEALITKEVKKAETTDFEVAYIQENKVKVTIPPIEKLNKEIFKHELWVEYTGRCVACGRCNTSCITCSCYTMQDVFLSDDQKVSERRRVWAGCHVDGFSDMAGGHSFRTIKGERMRFKTMHKVNDFYKRFGEHMCVGCGRCDDVCPEYISFSNCINKLNQLVEEETTRE